MQVVVNSLPTRTWNHLGMNEAVIDLDGAYPEKFPENAQRQAQVPAEKDSALAPLLGSEAALVETEKNQNMDTPAVLRISSAKGERSSTRISLHAGENSVLKALILLEGEQNGEEQLLVQTQIQADRNAKVQLYAVQLVSRSGLCVHELLGTCQEGAEIVLTDLELGAKNLYSDIHMDLLGKESSFRGEIGYHAKPGQKLDFNYVAVHEGKKTQSQLEVNGTLEEKARKLFRGTIDFRKGCAGAKGDEHENVLLMADDLVNQTLPVILCKEEDVEGNHGASIGQLDEKILFYLASRGIPLEEAQQLIAQARIEAICNKIPLDDVKEKIHAFRR